MFWIKTIVAFIIIAGIVLSGSVLQRHLSGQSSPRPGLIMPVVCSIIAIALSIPHFITTFSMNFSLLSFIASVCLFVFYSIPAMVFFLIYFELRQQQSTKNRRRVEKTRQARREVTREEMIPRPPAHHADRFRPKSPSSERTRRR